MQCQSCGQDNPPGAQFCARCGAALIATAELHPTAVSLEYSGFWIRLGAAIIDSLIISAAAAILVRLGPSPFPIFVGWLYLWLLTGHWGQTLGKKLLGIKVVDQQGNIPGLSRAALREIVGKTVVGFTLGLGYLWIIWDKQKQGLHDKIASTYVIKVK